MTLQKKETSPSNALMITLSNSLIEARYSLSLAEQRLLLMMLSKIQPDDTEFKECRISIHEFATFMDIDKNHVYTQYKKIIEKLSARVLDINDFNTISQTIHWVASAQYIAGEGRVKLCFDPTLKPYLLQLQANFTCCKLDILLSFVNQYTQRIYMLLKRYEAAKDYEIELEQLRAMLGITPEKYQLYTNFKKDILDITRKELTEKADLSFEFEEIKYGRRVGVIRFRIISNEKLQKSLPLSSDQEAAPSPASKPATQPKSTFGTASSTNNAALSFRN